MNPINLRLRWIGGALTPWAILWLVFGLRVLSTVKAAPHPLLKGLQLTGVMKTAAVEWALTALAGYLVLGLVLGLLVKLATSEAGGANLVAHLSFRDGLLAGTGTVVYFHAVLYTAVPMGMVGLPLLNRLPAGLVLLVLLGAGAWILWRVFQRESLGLRPLRWAVTLLAFSLLPFVPHDLLRRHVRREHTLPADTPRAMILGIDGLRRDTFERLVPGWKAPAGLNPVAVAPATRRSWSYLFGKNPEELKTSIIMPFRSDLSNPDSFELLSEANAKGYRIAWAIDDSMTASFGYQLGFFSTAKEAPGGWKYWFSLGLGTTWPAWSWTENYISEIETTNPWSDPTYFWRDVGRLLENHHLVFAHSCFTHEPIRLHFDELRRLYGWRWLLDGIYHYRPCLSPEEVGMDDGYRADDRSSAFHHYEVRTRSGLVGLRPALEDWKRTYPQLSGVLTSDHGESHTEIRDATGAVLTHLEGIHGFNLEPYSMWVPYHPFGTTRTDFKPGDLLTWIELRDALKGWVQSPGPLQVRGRPTPLFFQFPTVRAVQQESEDQAELAKTRGLDPRELTGLVILHPDGIWYAPDESRARFATSRMSVGWAEGDRLTLFNPSGKGTYQMESFRGYSLEQGRPATDEEVAALVAPYVPWAPQPYPVAPSRQSHDPVRHVPN